MAKDGLECFVTRIIHEVPQLAHALREKMAQGFDESTTLGEIGLDHKQLGKLQVWVESQGVDAAAGQFTPEKMTLGDIHALASL